MSKLFNPLKLGSRELKNRLVMPPMTRSRAGKGEVATELAAEYYVQRASAGLIITEGTQISQQGRGYAWTPGIHSEEQVEGWLKVTKKVHDNNGVIYAQLWHVGRVSHNSLQPENQAPVSSSEIIAEGVRVFIDPDNKGPESGVGEMIQHSKPRALTIPEIKEIVKDFAKAAANAVKAGFDGVEVHGANDYLINQFIDSNANNRTDEYGGCLENRLRFLKEVITAIANEIGGDKVGVRLAPFTTLQGAVDATPEATYLEAAKILNEIGIGYIHIAEADWDDAPGSPEAFKNELRKIFKGVIIYAGHYTKEKADEALALGWADMIGFGRAFIANPDLPYRLANNLELNKGDKDTYFGGGTKGYTDYPKYM